MLLDLVYKRQDGAPTPTPPGQPIPNRFPQIYGFIGSFLSLATIAIFLRLVSRHKFSYIGPDDIAILIAYVLFIGGIIATLVAMQYGLGIHIWDVDSSRVISMQKCGFASQVLYPPSLAFTKLSILLFLSRVVPVTSSWKKGIWAIVAFVVCQETAFTITLVLQCRPTTFYWDKSIDGTCINQVAFYYVDASVNIFTDVVILALPWMIFSSLRIPRRKKYALLAICSAGAFTLVTSIVRLPFLHDLNKSSDPSWTTADIATWSIAEIGSAITTASIPTIRPLISHIFPKFMRSTANHTADHMSSHLHPPNTYALSSIRERITVVKSYAEIHAGKDSKGDGESEKYILAENGRVIRQTVEMSVSTEGIEADGRDGRNV